MSRRIPFVQLCRGHYTSSERKPRSELNLPRTIGLRCNQTKSGVRRHGIPRGECRVITKVERLQTQPEICALGKSEILEQGSIELIDPILPHVRKGCGEGAYVTRKSLCGIYGEERTIECGEIGVARIEAFRRAKRFW
jgi:hypothetical protein